MKPPSIRFPFVFNILFTAVLLFIAGCGYTVLDIPQTPLKPYEQFRVYDDTIDVPFDYREIGAVSQSIQWQNPHFDFEPLEYEKFILLSRLASSARYYYADGLIKVRFYSQGSGSPSPRNWSDRRNRSPYHYSVGTAIMIRHVSE